MTNILTGYGETAGAAMTAHLGIDKIAFTASTEVGRRIRAPAVGNLKRVSLKLGGKSPMLVMPHVDVDAVIGGAVPGIFFSAGQSCICGLAPDRAREHGRATEGSAARARTIRVGCGLQAARRSSTACKPTSAAASIRARV